MNESYLSLNASYMFICIYYLFFNFSLLSPIYLSEVNFKFHPRDKVFYMVIVFAICIMSVRGAVSIIPLYI